MSFFQSIKTRRGKLDLRQARLVRKRFRKYVLRHRGALILAGIAAIGATLAELAAPWTIKLIFDYVLSDHVKDQWLIQSLHTVAGSPLAALGWICGAIILIAIMEAIFNYARDVLLAQTGQRIVGELRQDVFEHLQKLPPGEFERRTTGDMLTRLTGDITMLRQMLCDALVTVGQGVLLIIAMATALFLLNAQLALIAMAAVPLTAWATLRISRKIRKATRRAREKESLVTTIAHDVLGAVAVVQAFNREDAESARFGRHNRSSVRAGVRTTRLEASLSRVVSLSSAVALCAILYVGVRAVLTGTMTAGDLLVFIAYMRALGKPMRRIAKVTGQVAKATTCGQRVSELLAIKPAIANAKDAIDLPPGNGDIVFDHVNFRYRNGTIALNDVSLRIEAGQRVAVVGQSGAGKSTLIKLLLRFCDPLEGSVVISGIDLRKATIESLRKRIGWVHQDTVLFGLTVRQNIALGRADASDEQIERVVQQVKAGAFIEALPRGYNTPLGQSGMTLSGGQRQRLALARALLREPSILLLDEPATGLDAMTREVVTQAWMSPEHRATTIVICHRLQEMDRFDRVIVLDAGRIIAQGTHRELLDSCMEYAQSFAADRAAGAANAVALAEEPAPC